MMPTPKSTAVEKVGVPNHSEDDGSREAVVASTASDGGHGEVLTPSMAVEGMWVLIVSTTMELLHKWWRRQQATSAMSTVGHGAA